MRRKRRNRRCGASRWTECCCSWRGRTPTTGSFSRSVALSGRFIVVLGSKTPEQVKRRYEQLIAAKQSGKEAGENGETGGPRREKDVQPNRYARVLRSSKDAGNTNDAWNTNESRNTNHVNSLADIGESRQEILGPNASATLRSSTVSTVSTNSKDVSEGKRGFWAQF